MVRNIVVVALLVMLQKLVQFFLSWYYCVLFARLRQLLLLDQLLNALRLYIFLHFVALQAITATDMMPVLWRVGQLRVCSIDGILFLSQVHLVAAVHLVLVHERALTILLVFSGFNH